jgi:hypothetical protein
MKRLKSPSPEIILIVGIILILFVPWLLTRSLGIISFTDTGTIGDTIGGITAPITGLIGSYLVYMALKAQIEANKIITDQFKEQKVIGIVTDQLKILREDIKDFSFTYIEWDSVYRETKLSGPEAIEKVLDTFPTEHIDINDQIGMNYRKKIIEIQYFLESVFYLIDLSIRSKLKDEDRDNLIRIIFETYSSKLRIPLWKNEEKRSSKIGLCPRCNFFHAIGESVYQLYEKIENGIKDVATVKLL